MLPLTSVYKLMFFTFIAHKLTLGSAIQKHTNTMQI